MSARRIRVLFVVGSLGTGGAERFVSTCLGLLDRTRFDPMLAVFRPDIIYPLPSDVPLLVMNKSKPWHNPRAILRLAQWIDGYRPDIVLSAWSYPNLFTAAALWVARYRPRWVARAARNPGREERGLFRFWARVAYRRADHIIANSRGLADGFRGIYPFLGDRISVLYNPTDFGYLDRRAAESPPAPLPKHPTLIWAGRLEPQKRPDLILDAFARIAPQCEAHLLILGEGSLRPDVEARIAALNLVNRVTMMGFCSNPYAIMARADAFILTSDDEGLPNALIEAQGLGLPAVATDCPYGPGEIIEPGRTGYLVPVGNAELLAAAMDRVLADPEASRAMGRAARERVRSLFSVEQIGPEISAFLEDVVRLR